MEISMSLSKKNKSINKNRKGIKIEKNEFVNIGKRIPKLDALEKVTGSAVYPQDIKLPGMVYGKILWSEHAHAQILDIDTNEAENLPGVFAVITSKDMPPTKIGIAQDNFCSNYFKGYATN
jgi:CO/xanthine dehydrogenase Mo-binding subunit